MTICAMLGLWCSLGGHAYVIDGDTLVVNTIHLRLWGIDAEELSEPNGYQAKRALTKMIGTSNVECVDKGERSYGRTVAMCWTKDKPMVSLNARMVESGYALDCAHYSGGKFRALEPAGIRAVLKQKPYC